MQRSLRLIVPDKLVLNSCFSAATVGEEERFAVYKIYQPISLQNIAAATSIKKLNSFKSCELLFVSNTLKNKQLFIRAGPNHERKLYSFITTSNEYEKRCKVSLVWCSFKMTKCLSILRNFQYNKANTMDYNIQ